MKAGDWLWLCVFDSHWGSAGAFGIFPGFFPPSWPCLFLTGSHDFPWRSSPRLEDALSSLKRPVFLSPGLFLHCVCWHQQEHHAAALAGANKEKSNPLSLVSQLGTLVHPLGVTAFIPDTSNSIYWLFSPCFPGFPSDSIFFCFIIVLLPHTLPCVCEFLISAEHGSLVSAGLGCCGN